MVIEVESAAFGILDGSVRDRIEIDHHCIIQRQSRQHHVILYKYLILQQTLP